MNQRFCNGMIHVIKPGDNLYQLSRRYRVPLALILRANPYVDVYNLRPGQEICIPMSRPGRPMLGPESKEMQRDMGMDDRQDDRYDDREDHDREDRDGDDYDQEDYDRDDRGRRIEMEECPDERCTYRSDGTKSLGKILEENGLSMTEFFERNDPNQVVIASDVMLDIPKKV